MQAVILAAGLGTRMGELTKETPKPLLEYKDGKSLLKHNLLALPEEVGEVIIVVGYLQEQIRAAIGEEFVGKKVTYVEQKELKGTAHAVSLCKDLVRGRFLVLMGDDLYHKRDLEKLVKNPLGVLVWQIIGDESDVDRQAIVKVSEAGELEDIIERRPARAGQMVNTGAYVLNEEFFKHPLVGAGNPPKEFGLPQTFLQMLPDGAKFAVVPAEKWHKVAKPEDLEA